MTAQDVSHILRQPPTAAAELRGSGSHPNLRGRLRFYQTKSGVLICAEVNGLPTSGEPGAFFGFHIHSGNSCTGNREDPFADAKTHFNPKNLPHPDHAGDLPPLLGNHGTAFMIFLTDRFSVREILGRTVVIHAGRDDFTTQPAGNSGEKIACGEIHRTSCF